MAQNTAATPQGSQFDAQARTWDEDPRKVKVAQAIAQAMLEALRLTPADTVLDYGAGTGLVALELAGAAGLVIAAEPSEGMRAVLAEKLAVRGVANVVPVGYSAQDGLPLGHKPTVISGSMVLHHVEDVPQAARAFAALLPEGGRIAFADLDYEGGAFHGPDQHAFHPGFHRQELGRTFEAAGFADLAFTEVMQVRKPNPDGSTGVFPVFLMTGRKA